MLNVDLRCAHCEAPIVDPTTRRVHGESTFCCPNCAQAMERRAGGTDPGGTAQENAIRCARCTVAIVDDSAIEEVGGDIYCCRNCASAAQGS